MPRASIPDAIMRSEPERAYAVAMERYGHPAYRTKWQETRVGRSDEDDPARSAEVDRWLAAHRQVTTGRLQ
jgi:hypothetical protein